MCVVLVNVRSDINLMRKLEEKREVNKIAVESTWKSFSGEESGLPSIMKDSDYQNERELTQGNIPSPHQGQTIDSDTSSGSIYQTPVAQLDSESHLTAQHPTSSAISESDSAEHFSDAVQESDDTASVYSAEEAPQREDQFQLLISKSSVHQFSAEGSRVSILPNDSSGLNSRIPLPCHALEPQISVSKSHNCFRLEESVGNSEGSRIPIPVRIRNNLIGQSLKGSKSEPRIPSRSASPDKEVQPCDHPGNKDVISDPNASDDYVHEDILSSESENITAISTQPQGTEEGTLEKYQSDDLLGDSVQIPFDAVEPCIDALVATIEPSTDDQSPVKVLSPAIQDSLLIPDQDPTSDASDTAETSKCLPPTLSNLRTPELVEVDQLSSLNSGNVQEDQERKAEDQECKAEDQEREAEDRVNSDSDHISSSLNESKSAAEKPFERPIPVVKTEIIKVVELDRVYSVESWPVSPIEYLQVNINDLIEMGQAVATKAGASKTSRMLPNVNKEKHEDESRVELDRVVSQAEDDHNDDEYDEIDDSPSVKKMTRFGKLKSKLKRRVSSKEVHLKATGSSAKTTLKVRRKPVKASSSRPSSARRPSTPPVTPSMVLKPKGTPGVSRFSSIRASIKQDVEKMKMGKLETDIGLKKRSLSDLSVVKGEETLEHTKVELKEAKLSNHSMRDIFHDPVPYTSKDGANLPTISSLKNQRTSKEDNQPPVIPLNQSKLNTLKSRYRLHMKKYKCQLSDLNDMQTKSGTQRELLSDLKSQIIGMTGAMPTTLDDIPDPLIITVARSEVEEEPSLKVEAILAEKDTLKVEVARLSTDLNLVSKENKLYRNELSALKEQLSSTRSQLSEFKKTANDKTNNFDYLKLEVQKAKRMTDTYKRKLDEHQKSTQEQKLLYEEEKSKRVEHEQQLMTENNSLKSKLQLEITKKECMEHALAIYREEKENLEAQTQAHHQKIQDLQLELGEHMEEINRAKVIQEEYALLEDNVRKLEMELTNSRKYCESLASRIDSSEKAEEETSKQLIRLSEELLEKMNLIQQLSNKQRSEHGRRMDFPVYGVDYLREKRRMRKFNMLKSKRKRARMDDDEEEYKIISNLSSLIGFEVDFQELATDSEKENCENTPLMTKICSDIEKVVRNKDAEIEKHKKSMADLEGLHQEKQALIEQLYEFVNEKNASICQRSSSPRATDNKDEEKNAERSPTMVNIVKAEAVGKRNPDFQELYSMLEVKRHTLLRMESQIRNLQEVHAHCGMRRTMQESRIAELETMLANCLD